MRQREALRKLIEETVTDSIKTAITAVKPKIKGNMERHHTQPFIADK